MHARLTIPCSCALVLFGTSADPAAAEKFEVDSAHSSALFRMLHMGFSNAWGRFNNITGVVDLDEQNPAKSLIDMTIASDSVDTGVASATSTCAAPISSTSANFPKSISRASRSCAVGPGSYEVAGTSDAARSLQATDRHAHENWIGQKPLQRFRLGVETSFQIKRADFDMKNMLEGVGNDVLLIVSLEAAHK